jgi:hypothetical protein
MAENIPPLTVESLHLVSWGDSDTPPPPELDEDAKSKDVCAHDRPSGKFAKLTDASDTLAVSRFDSIA